MGCQLPVDPDAVAAFAAPHLDLIQAVLFIRGQLYDVPRLRKDLAESCNKLPTREDVAELSPDHHHQTIRSSQPFKKQIEYPAIVEPPLQLQKIAIQFNQI